jgi:hypothetical protein
MTTLQRLPPIARGNRMSCFGPITFIAAFGTAPSDWAAAGFPDTFDGTMCLGEIDGNEKKVQR